MARLRLPPRVSDPHTEIRSSTNRVPTSTYTRAYTPQLLPRAHDHRGCKQATLHACARASGSASYEYTHRVARATIRRWCPSCTNRRGLCFHRKHTELQNPDVTLYRLLAVSGPVQFSSTPCYESRVCSRRKGPGRDLCR